VVPHIDAERKLRAISAELRGPARVLVVGDATIARLMRLALNHGDYFVRIATTASEGERVKHEWNPHLLVVDIDLDEGGAIALVGHRRQSGRRMPAIALTQRGDMRTKLAAFDQGADDFVTMPFSPEELVARVLAVMRRTYAERVPFFPTIRIGDVEIDILHQRICVGQSRLRLSAIEQSLLYLLASNPGEVMTREMILDTVWGSDYVAESNVVDRHVRNLRIKLKHSYRAPRYIATVPGKGYRFLLAPTAQPATA
jgi:DNA-binding response OmpR family regulator